MPSDWTPQVSPDGSPNALYDGERVTVAVLGTYCGEPTACVVTHDGILRLAYIADLAPLPRSVEDIVREAAEEAVEVLFGCCEPKPTIPADRADYAGWFIRGSSRHDSLTASITDRVVEALRREGVVSE